jgi:ubiquinone/menaquinone biosynthesis C-methylase UbiE
MTTKKEVIEYYSNFSEAYDRIRLGGIKNKVISNFQVHWFINGLEVGSSYLEVGCGTGRLTLNITKKVGFLVATDGSLEMIRINRQHTRTLKLKDRLEYVLCDACHLPFVDECFAGVVGARVFWHIPDYVSALEEALRVDKRGGSLSFDFPSIWGPFGLFSKMRGNKGVLTEFSRKESFKLVFRNVRQLSFEGNTSFLLFFVPGRLFGRKTVRNLVSQFEKLSRSHFKDFLFAYCMIRATK